MNDLVSLIPARGGSRGIKRKNLSDIGGMPLIAHSILASLGTSGIEKTYVSSEDREIKEVANLYGAEVINRPMVYAGDESSTESVITHFFSQVKCNHVVLIQPTSPMIIVGDLQKGISVYFEGKYDSLFSAVRTNDKLIWDEECVYPLNYDPKNRGTRQTRRKSGLLIENGMFFIFSKKMYIKNHCRLGGKIGYSEVPFWRSFQIDEPNDLVHVRTLMTLKAKV